LVSTTSLGSEYIVSFEIFVNSFSVPNLKAGKYAEIIRLSTTEGNCCEDGDRIVQMSTVGGAESDGIEFSSSTGGMDAYFYHKFDISKDVWTKVDIELSLDSESLEHYFTIKKNGVTELSTPADFISSSFEDVKVWASTPAEHNGPPPADARIRNLTIRKP